MQFPHNFPFSYKPEAEAAVLTAVQKYPRTGPLEPKIIAGMDAFSRIALRAVRNGDWSLESASYGFEDFLTSLCESEARRFVGMSGASFLAQNMAYQTKEAILQSDLWIGYVKKLAAVAKTLTKYNPKNRTRRSIVLPILKTKGWSIYDWANEAEVAHATAMDYLDEKTTPYRSTIKKLADALGLPIDKMPD